MLTVSDLKEACEAIEREYGSDGTYVLLVSPDAKERIGDSIKLPDNVQLRTSPFVEENKAYLLRERNLSYLR